MIILFGPPGAGKGTQAANLIDTYSGKYLHLSTGDILRADKTENPEGKVAKLMNAGKLVDDRHMTPLINKALENVKFAGKIPLVDGFPRNVDQAKHLMKKTNKALVFVFTLSSASVEERIKKRGVTSGRTDDSDITVIKERLKVYEEKTKPVLDFLNQNANIFKVVSIDASRSIGEVFQDVTGAIDS